MAKTGSTTKQKIEDFAEDLGKLLGSARSKAESWLSQRKAIVKHLSEVRDAASGRAGAAWPRSAAASVPSRQLRQASTSAHQHGPKGRCGRRSGPCQPKPERRFLRHRRGAGPFREPARRRSSPLAEGDLMSAAPTLREPRHVRAPTAPLACE